MSSGETLLNAAGLTEFRQGLREVLSEAARAVRQGSFGEGAATLTAEMARLRGASASHAEAVVQNTQAVLQNTLLRGSGGVASAASAAGKWALGIATGGVAPLITGLLGLFRGHREEAAPLLVSYARPQAAALEGTTAGDRVSWNWRDGVRPASTPQQVTVQVQAMDSRSFLDHRDEIARAVREAVLHSHSLNDVLAEL